MTFKEINKRYPGNWEDIGNNKSPLYILRFNGELPHEHLAWAVNSGFYYCEGGLYNSECVEEKDVNRFIRRKTKLKNFA